MKEDSTVKRTSILTILERLIIIILAVTPIVASKIICLINSKATFNSCVL